MKMLPFEFRPPHRGLVKSFGIVNLDIAPDDTVYVNGWQVTGTLEEWLPRIEAHNSACLVVDEAVSETQQTVAQWAREAFDAPGMDETMLKLRQEVTELEMSIHRAAPSIQEEIADITILLWQIADFYEINIQEEVNKKMAINRGRVWEKQADGTYQHKGEQ